jgi:hypothetical protein
MNLIGKIFIVLIFIMSLVFMSFAIAVYSTHTNWREVVERKEATSTQPLGLKYQLENARKDNQALKDEHERLLGEAKAEKERQAAALAALASEYKTLTDQHKQLVEKHNVLDEKHKADLATLATQSDTLKAQTAEVAGLRDEIRKTQADRDERFNQVVTLTEALNQAKGMVQHLRDRGLQPAADLAAQKKVLDAHRLTKDTPVDNIPPDVRGKVLAVNKDKMLEISIGSDDGLRVGHTLEISRPGKYLGRMEVLSIKDDKAVGRIVPGFQQGVIQKGDDVTTRFKVS